MKTDHFSDPWIEDVVCLCNAVLHRLDGLDERWNRDGKTLLNEDARALIVRISDFPETDLKNLTSSLRDIVRSDLQHEHSHELARSVQRRLADVCESLLEEKARRTYWADKLPADWASAPTQPQNAPVEAIDQEISNEERVAKVLLLIKDNPDWTQEQLAQAVQRTRGWLYKQPAIRAALQIGSGRDLPKGQKSEDGLIEAEDHRATPGTS